MKDLAAFLEHMGMPAFIVSIVIAVLPIVGWVYTQNWWGIKDRISNLISATKSEVTVALDSTSCFYVPSDERNLEDDKWAYYSVFLPILTIRASSKLTIHGVDVLIADGSLSESADCNQLILQCSEHTTDWIRDFQKHCPAFRNATIEEGDSKRISIPKCAVTTTPMRGYGSSSELPFVYLIVIVHIHVSYLSLLCRVYEMSPRIHRSVILAHELSDKQDVDQLERWVTGWKQKDFEKPIRGIQFVRTRI